MKTSHTLTYIFLFLVHTVQSQTIDFNQGNFNNDSYFIELSYQNINDKIIVEIELGGKIRKFILDTGAPLVVSSDLFKELNFQVLAKQSITDINQNNNSVLIVSVDSLKIGDYFHIATPAIVLENNVIMNCLNIDGFIGSNVLRNSVIQFDSKSQTIKIANDISKLNLDKGKGYDLMLDQQSSPYLRFHIGKKISEFVLFDSASDEFYSMANQKIEKFLKAKDFKIIHKSNGSNSIGVNGVADYNESSLMHIPFVSLGGVKIENVISETNNDINSRTGAKILQYGNLTLDYRNKKYYFDNTTDQIEFRSNQLQISPTYLNNSFSIGKIWTKELEKKVSIGDKIITVNGVNAESWTVCQILNNKPFSIDYTFDVDIKKANGELISIKVGKIELK